MLENMFNKVTANKTGATGDQYILQNEPPSNSCKDGVKALSKPNDGALEMNANTCEAVFIRQWLCIISRLVIT